VKVFNSRRGWAAGPQPHRLALGSGSELGGIHWMLKCPHRGPRYPAAMLLRGVAEAAGPGRLNEGARDRRQV
jgi:hypothetical protein